MSKVNSFACCFMVLLSMSCSSAWAKKADVEHTVSGIYLDVLRIDACAAKKGCVAASGPMQLNLLDLADGQVDFASKVLLPARTKELRLVLGDNSTIAVNEESFPLDVPSGKSSGLKLKGQRVFSKEGGFLAGLTLSLNLKKQLVIQAKKVKAKGNGKGKKNSVEEVLYSFKLKPVVAVKTADVEPLPENMAAVVAVPNDDVTLTLGDDFSMQIPAGAVSEAKIITADEIKYFVEVKDEATGAIVKKLGLSSTYELAPEGTQFAKPLQIAIHYRNETLPHTLSEENLAIFHDGDSLSTDLNTILKVAKGDILHFSEVTLAYDYSKSCTKSSVKEGIVYFDCNSATSDFPDFHAVIVDRAKLNDKYKLRILADESSPAGTFNTKTVQQLAEKNEAIIAINGSYFGPQTVDYSKENEHASPSHTTVMNGSMKTNHSGNEVLMALGDQSSNSVIPIQIFTKDKFNSLWNGDNQEEKKILSWAIGTDATILELNNGDKESTCRYKYNTVGDSNSGIRSHDEEVSAIGYSNKEIIFISSNLDSYTDNEFDTWYSLCEVFRSRDVKSQAIALDSGCSVQLSVNGTLKNGVCTWDHRPEQNDDGSYNYNDDGSIQKDIYLSNEARHVVNAIALVPKDQEDPENPPPDPPSDKEIKLEEYQASCHGTEDYWHDQDVGSGGKSLWTYNNDSAHGVDNYCTYSFSGVTPGKWEVQVFIPSNHATTRQACYEIMDGSKSYGAEVDQYTVYDDWVSLGVFEATGNSLKVRLTDMTDEGYGVNWVGFDAIRVIPTDKEVKRYVPSCNPPQP